jgi:hypothetical protein
VEDGLPNVTRDNGWAKRVGRDPLNQPIRHRKGSNECQRRESRPRIHRDMIVKIPVQTEATGTPSPTAR